MVIKITLTLLLISLALGALGAPLTESTDEDDFFADTDADLHPPATEKPETVKIDTYIQKIPRKGHIKQGEELEKCLTGEPDKGHPHLHKEDIEDVAEVLIAHTKEEPEHEHKFKDLPLTAQADIADKFHPDSEEDKKDTTTEKVTETPAPSSTLASTEASPVVSAPVSEKVDESPKEIVKEVIKEVVKEAVKEVVTEVATEISVEAKKEESTKATEELTSPPPRKLESSATPSDDDKKQDERRKKRETQPKKERVLKVSRPKLKTSAEKKKEKELAAAAEPKPEPIPISIHEVAGFDKIKKKIKRDTDAVTVKRPTGFIRPKPVSEILKHHAIKPAKKVEDEAQAEEVEYDEEEESLPIQARKEPEVEKPKKTYSARQSKAL